MAGGVSSGTIDQTTATGMSIITSIAQKIIQARKQHYTWAYEQVGEQFLQVMGQMMRGDRAIQVMGKEGNRRLMLLSRSTLQGDFDCKINVMDDVMLQGERRASAQAMMQAAAGVAGLTPVNMKAYMENLLDAYDIRDKPKYFMPDPGTAGAAGQPQVPVQTSTPSAENVQQAQTQAPPVPGMAPGLTARPDPQVAAAAQASSGSALAPAGRQQ